MRIFGIHAQDMLVNTTRNAENDNMNILMKGDVKVIGGGTREDEKFPSH